jgi:histidinol-phosphate aminotransferase
MGLRDNIARMAGYVPGEQPRQDGIIKLNTNENPYPPSPQVFEAIRSCLTGDRLRKYPDPSGLAFRTAVGKLYQIDRDSILIGNGSDDLLTILTRAFVPEGGLIASPTPSYILYRSLAEIQGARFETVPFMADWKLPEVWPIPQADLTFVPNPNSPSGTVVENRTIQSLSESLKNPLVLDEAYVDFAETNGLSLVSKKVIVTRTMSKSYSLAGIRFGFGISDPSVIYELNKVKDSYNCDVLSLAAATAAVEDQDYLMATRAKILATRQRMESILPRFGFQVTPSQANFVWCQRSDRPLKPIYEALKDRGILVRFMSYPQYGDGLRISVGTDAEIDRLFAQLEIVLNR